jgi:hypothetical protein
MLALRYERIKSGKKKSHKSPIKSRFKSHTDAHHASHRTAGPETTPGVAAIRALVALSVSRILCRAGFLALSRFLAFSLSL